MGLLFNLIGLIYNILRARRCGALTNAADWLAILEAARQYEKEAEHFSEYSGAEKLQYVLSRLRVFTAELGYAFDEAALIEKIKKSRELGKHNFIVLVSEGMGHDFGPALTERIEAATGVESRFARLAHVVRGGQPTQRDRLMASRMGKFAVEELFNGRSNIVICERDNRIISCDIGFALTLDRMYKGKLKDGDLDKYTATEIAEMTALVEKRKAALESLAEVASALSL